MGVVYRVKDRERGVSVALKTMAHVDPVSLLRFKREFRALADIAHPNVVALHDLFSEGEHWFFTMELVDGVDFLGWVQELDAGTPSSGRERSAVRAMERAMAPTLDAASFDGPAQARAPTERPPRAGPAIRDVQRLRQALAQLARGVAAIHRDGRLHRDIKPSNVLVTPEGRVVLLDFGVVGDFAPDRPQPADEQILGTPGYMAPEQAAGGGAGPASDWYAVGVMLFEALTGQLPFDGTAREIIDQKLAFDAPRASSLAAFVPADLDELCAELLSRDPYARPGGPELLARLAGEGASQAYSLVPATGPVPVFVGRQQEIAELDRAFAAARQDRPSVVLLSGHSGMGKSALVTHFLQRIAREPGVLTLSGRCYERESVPFKGLDSVVDELSRWLGQQPHAYVESVVPPGIHELSRVFPVLRGVRAIAEAPRAAHAVVEPHEIRRRAFAALRALLAALAEEWTPVIHVDDLQWGDVDSVGLLRELLEPPGAPPVLLVCGYRDELAAGSAAVPELLASLPRLRRGADVREVTVDRLSESEAVDLARSSMDVALAGHADVAYAIARESQGIPFFVAELVQWEAERRRRGAREPGLESAVVSLPQVIADRVAELPAASRALLEVLSIATCPVAQCVAERAAGGATIPRSTLSVLRAARLVRVRVVDDQEVLEAFHSRIRETIVADLDAARQRELHVALARELEATGHADAEALFEHYLSGGDLDSARRHVVVAAETAARGLAFARAARLYRAAIEIRADAPVHELRHKAGDALAAAGRVAAAADEYLAGAASAPRAAAIELRRLAAENYLKSGREEQGLASLRDVLRAVDLPYPSTLASALASLLASRTRLRFRGLEMARGGATPDPDALARVDVAFSATVGLAMVDLVRGADFAARHLRLALDAGEPVRLCRALALEAGNAAAVADGARDRAGRLVRVAEDLATRVDDPHGMALVKLASGMVRFFSGEWRSSERELDEAEALLRERCQAVAWELANARSWACNASILMGELKRTSERVPIIVREAADREDAYALMNLVYPACITRIVADEVDAAWQVSMDHAASFATRRYNGSHWGALISAISVHRYRGEGGAAWERVEREWKRLDSAQLLRINVIRMFSRFERALCAVTVRRLDEAEREGKRLARERMRHGAPMSDLVLGCVAGARGHFEPARSLFAQAAAGLDREDMRYLAAAARYRQGELTGGTRERRCAPAPATTSNSRACKTSSDAWR